MPDQDPESAIPATVHMISGCQDSQTSADVSNVATFRLPDPAGRAGGACTSALLKVLYEEHHKPTNDLTFVEVLLGMRDILGEGDFTQIPQLTSSKPLDVSKNFYIVPEDCEGKKRALLIGINYIGQSGELSGCHNDVHNIKEYIMDVWGFEEDNITILMDDGEHEEPTRDNILKAYKALVDDSESGDAVFCHYSGHGGKLRDDDGDEKDGYDETLVPVDYQRAQQIRDDDLYSTLIGPMAEGVTLTAIMDCCHSGSVLDLPYKFIGDGEHEGMELDDNFDFERIQQFAANLTNFIEGLQSLWSQFR